MKQTKDCIIRHKNKANGVTYIYYGHSNYDKNGKCTTKGARKCIGKINVQDEFEPNNTFRLMTEEEQLATGLVERPYLPPVNIDVAGKGEYMQKFYGYTAIIEAAAKSTGVYAALSKVFPNRYLDIMSMLEALMVFPERNLYSFRRFHSTYWHMNIDSLSEDAITDALKDMANDENRRRYFNYMSEKHKNKELVVAINTTSISTYSTMLNLARYGHNKEDDDLPQVNLLMVCEAETGIPVYYRSLAGNMSDKKTIAATVEDIKNDLSKKAVFCMDRGFCTLENMRLFLKSGYTFITLVPSTCPFHSQAIEASVATIDDTNNYVKAIERYCYKHEIKIEAPRRGPGENAYTMGAFVFRDTVAEIEERNKLTLKFAEGLDKLNEDPTLFIPEKNNWYRKYFVLIEEGTKRKKPVYGHNTEAQSEAKRRCGLNVIIAPADWSPEKVSRAYSQRDVIEKDFESWKEKMRRPRHSIDEHLEGKIFLVYLVTIIECALRYIMREHYLDREDTFQSIVDKIFNASWRKPTGKSFKDGHWADLTLEQIKLLHIFGVSGMQKLLRDVDNKVNADDLKRQGLKPKRGRKPKK